MHCIEKKGDEGFMESPKTYHGYDETGKCVVSATATDANTVLNPADVKAAIDNVKSAFEDQFKAIADALRGVSTDASEAVIVEGTNMKGTIEDTATLLTQVSGQVTQGIDGLYDLAVNAHDEIQAKFNTDAYNACRVTGVVAIN